MKTTQALPAISEHAYLRLFVVFILYVAQGVPYGLVFVAIPAWLVTNEVSPTALGLYLSASGLPWTLKFMHGFFMDRYAYLPMGRRRAWLIGSQSSMVLVLLICALLNPSGEQAGLLAAFGFVLMLGTTLQDVAVDGMAVDLLKDQERAQANGMMFGGQSIGIAAGGAVGGILIASSGLVSALIVTGGFLLLVLLMVIVLRERPGEKLMPWSHGETAAINLQHHQGAWIPVLRNTFKKILKTRSVCLMMSMVMIYACWGFFLGLAPLVTVNVTGWTDAMYSSTSGGAYLLSGVISVLIFGALVHWIGPRWGMLLSTSALAVLSLFMAFNEPLWAQSYILTSYIYIAITIICLIVVCWAVTGMRMCTPTVAATQFALYMAAPNLGSSIGSALLGPIEAMGGYQGVFIAMAVGLIFGGILFFLMGKPEPEPSIPDSASPYEELNARVD